MQRKETATGPRGTWLLAAAMALALSAAAAFPAAAFDERDESVVIANEGDPTADEPAAGEGETVGEPVEDAVVDGEPAAGQTPSPPPDDAGDDPAAAEPLDGGAAPKD